MKNKLLAILGHILSYMPMPFPQYEPEIEAFISEVLRLGNYPDNSSYKALVAQTLQTACATKFLMSKQNMVYLMRRRLATMNSFNVMQKHAAAVKAENEILPEQKV